MISILGIIIGALAGRYLWLMGRDAGYTDAKIESLIVWASVAAELSPEAREELSKAWDSVIAKRRPKK